MKQILIFGAGSIGNHMANAALKIKCNVFVTDINSAALQRMKDSIFPSRYGKWNKNITLLNYDKVFLSKSKYDLIIIGTPPNTHSKLFEQIKNRLKFKKILIEKPISNYLDKKANNLLLSYNRIHQNIYCGYNHSINKSFKFFYKKIASNSNKFNSISVEWKESFKGILGAHPWLRNEFHSYLGSIHEGGGSLQEHSHGLHLLNIILKIKKIKINNLDFKKNLIFKKNKKKKYDCFCNLATIHKNLFIKFETDLVTWPAQKIVKIFGDNYSIEWECNYKKNIDRVKENINGKDKSFYFTKTRSQEFENELQYIMNLSSSMYNRSFLNLYNALEVKDCFTKILNEK